MEYTKTRRYKKTSLTDLEKAILKSLAIKGSANISQINYRERLIYNSTNRAIKRLEAISLVWLSKRDEKAGPKGAQEYSLTPYGIAEAAFHILNDELIKDLINNFYTYTPRYVRKIDDFKRIGIWDDIKRLIDHRYPDFVKPYGGRYNIKFSEQYCIVQRNVMDIILLEEAFGFDSILSYDKIRQFFQLITQHADYIECWKKWFGVKKLVFNFVESLIRSLNKYLKVGYLKV